MPSGTVVIYNVCMPAANRIIPICVPITASAACIEGGATLCLPNGSWDVILTRTV